MSEAFSLAFSVLLNAFPTVYMFYNLFHRTPRMISDAFLATEQPETIMHWQWWRKVVYLVGPMS